MAEQRGDGLEAHAPRMRVEPPWVNRTTLARINRPATHSMNEPIARPSPLDSSCSQAQLVRRLLGDNDLGPTAYSAFSAISQGTRTATRQGASASETRKD
jgi:hypothetical protein